MKIKESMVEKMAYAICIVHIFIALLYATAFKGGSCVRFTAILVVIFVSMIIMLVLNWIAYKLSNRETPEETED